MEEILALVLSVIFFILSIIHFLWATGSEWSYDKVLPTDNDGKRVLSPRRIDCLIVAVGLLLFSIFYLISSQVVKVDVPSAVLKYGGWVFPLIFLIRAIGDFKYAGIFKRVKGTTFASWDNRLFTPLCLVIGIIGLTIAFLKQS